jgi:hypothetical protein
LLISNGLQKQAATFEMRHLLASNGPSGVSAMALSVVVWVSATQWIFSH